MGIVQTSINTRDEKWGLCTVDRALEEGCALVVFPEMWLTGFSTSQEALEKTERYIERLLEATRGANALIIAGTFPEEEDGRFFNTAYCISNARVVHKRRKLFLFEPMGETNIFSPGEPPATFEACGLKVGVAICYELRFPCIFERLMREEPHIVAVPAQWPHPRIEHWRTLLRARAVEGQYFIAGANVVGETEKFTFSGFSGVFHPLGHPIIEVSHTEGLFICTLDFDSMYRYRRLVPVARDLRLYG